MLFSILPTNTLSVRSTNNPFSNTPGILLIVISISFAFLIPSLNNTSKIRFPWSKQDRLNQPGFFANIYQLRPESRGKITLNSKDPFG